MKTIEIETLANWSNPKAVNTARGAKTLRTASPTPQFSTLWKAEKAAMQALGLAWSKSPSGDWQICWWQVDAEKAEKMQGVVEESHAAAPLSDVVIPAPAGCSYLPYQIAGIQFASSRQSVLIADEMGLGKTIQALGIINTDETIKTVLVVCPSSLKINWIREAKKWIVRADQFSFGRVDGKVWPTDCNFVVINYDVVSKHAEKIHNTQWDLIIMDEAHYCKNPKAQRTVALLGKWDRDAAKCKPAVSAKRKVVLTGTPILNRPIEAQPILGFLDKGSFGNAFGFAMRYCAAKRSSYGWDMSGASNLEELQTRLRSSIMVRRLKADVLTELPAKRRQVIELPQNGSASIVAQEKSAMERHSETLEGLRLAVEVAKLLEDSEAYALAIENLRSGQTAAFTEMAKIRHQVAMAKVPYVVEHVADISEDAPIVLFAHHCDVVDALMAGLTEAGRKCVKIVGGMTEEAKQASVDAFQNGQADVFIGNIKAAGVGITLVRSSHVVFAELDWVPANMSQAEDRTHRIGQTKSVLVQHLVLEGSLDQTMAHAIVKKQEIADAALDNPIAKIEIQEPVSTVLVVKDTPESKPVKINETPTREFGAEEIQTLLSNLRRLASVCDGAQEIDGQGFNGFDTRFGKELARKSTLSQKQANVAAKLCHKYRKQLGN